MIITKSDVTQFYVDLIRPNLFNDDDFRFWKNVHTLIKDCDIPIVVNGAFFFVEDCLTTSQNYGGGGMNYMFWFNTNQDKNDFMNLYHQIK